MDGSMNIQRRMERLISKLKARTNHEGEPLPGYKQNVASIRAEIATLQEQMGVDDGDA